MLPRRALAVALPATLALATAALTVGARSALEPEASSRGAVRNPTFLPSGRTVRLASMGQRLLLADFYWLRAVQYVGETVMAKVPRWEALYPLADIVTDLDPRFGYAYQIAGSNLGGLAHRYDEADRILQKGMAHLPERWSLPFVYATNKFIYEHKFAEAAEYTRRAAVIGKRPHLALLAANLSAVANTDDEYRTAIAFIDQMLAETDTDELRAELRARRVKIETYAALSDVEKAIAAHRARTGRLPARLADLVPGELARIPADPSGGRIVYDATTGEVRSTVIGRRAPITPNP
jgi:tetratricopeptide (TPR) repeat protein